MEELRDATKGLELLELGKRVCLDWNPLKHRKWFKGILGKLQEEQMIEGRSGRYLLKT